MAPKRASSGEGRYGPQPCCSWDPWQLGSLVTEGPYPDAMSDVGVGGTRHYKDQMRHTGSVSFTSDTFQVWARMG